jgi:hypothetical protein
MAQRLLKHIPNNKKGKEFISELRNHIDRDIVKVVKCRGRGKRKFTYTSKQGKQITSYHKDLNLDQAEKLAVYFEFDNQADYEHKYYKADSRLTSLEYTLQFLFKKTDLANIIGQIQEDIDDIQFLSNKYQELVSMKSNNWKIRQGLKHLLEIKNYGEVN